MTIFVCPNDLGLVVPQGHIIHDDIFGNGEWHRFVYINPLFLAYPSMFMYKCTKCQAEFSLWDLLILDELYFRIIEYIKQKKKYFGW